MCGGVPYGGARGPRGAARPETLPPPSLPPFWVRVLRTVVSHRQWVGGGDHGAKRTPPGNLEADKGGKEASVQPWLEA